MKTIENRSEEEFKRRSDAKSVAGEAISSTIDYYKQQMKSLLEGNVYLSRDLYKDMEKDIRQKAIEMFSHKCKVDPKIKKVYKSLFKQQLKQSKNEFKSKNSEKCEEITKNTEKQLSSAVEEYNQLMNDVFETFVSENEMSDTHNKIKQNVSSTFFSSCVNTETDFINKYLDQLSRDIDKCLIDWKNKLTLRMEGLHILFKSKVFEAKDYYIKV